MFIIPLTNSPNQSFTSTVPVNDKKIKFNFFLRFNTEQGCWMLTIKDEDKNILVSGIPLVCGLNILEQQSYLNIGSAYVIKLDDNIQRSMPNEFDLGTNFVLVWGDNE